ncbi:LysR family transcriptional regulator [Mycolicibacterium sp. P9-64]|uniref:LysR substrate-binding domain-containing protein n=1 Tax=Mycolicibacterium sp. P9-64 TaxID=2024612 RepID=UPI0011EBE76A|nr:LysR substrate-binding domain-containing protein [Mycolicibacterium sp. P9-64]KAA0084639.1 LysR family transcriptional regulator [Mycolicibacterium sp. P9-64]
MEVKQLEAFLAVSEHLHFGRAASQLFMAQAPLSRTISSLETELGARLFERNTRTVALTEAGLALIDPAREALSAMRRAANTVAAVTKGELGVLRVEFSGVAAHPIVVALARRMRAENPGIRVELASQPISRPAMQNLVDGATDVALGRWDQLPPGISSRVLMLDSLVVALPRTHRLASAETINFGDVAGEPFVSLPYSGGSITTDRLWRLGFAYGKAIDNVQFAPDTPSCIALVSADVGCHLALGSVGRRTTSPDVVFVKLAPEDSARVPDVHLRVAWRTTSPSPAVQAALQYLNPHPAGLAESDASGNPAGQLP